MNIINLDYTNNETFEKQINEVLDADHFGVEIIAKVHLKDTTKSKMNISIDHSSPNTVSRVKLRVVLENSAELKVFGDIFIRENADKCDAVFEAKVLMLGDKAHAQVLPKLRIDNRNVVQAKHAVVIKKVSDQDLRFMEARGLDNATSKNLVMEGFLNI